MAFRPAAPTLGQEDDIGVLTLALAPAGVLHAKEGTRVIVLLVWFAAPCTGCAVEMRLHLGDESALGRSSLLTMAAGVGSVCFSDNASGHKLIEPFRAIYLFGKWPRNVRTLSELLCAIRRKE